MAVYAEDLGNIMSDLNEATIVFGALTVKGVLDSPDELLLEAGQSAAIGKHIAVTYQTSALAALVVGSSITVDSVSYIVRERLKIGDGKLTRILCKVP